MKMRNRMILVLLIVLTVIPILSVRAEPSGAPPRETESLDGQVQKLKEEILELNTLLFRLQEELLFPEDSSMVVFLAIEGGNYFQLDSVKLNLDDTMVSSYLYTDREIGALKKGGIQRLYMGNVKSGDHELVAVFTGKGPQEKDYKRAETVHFKKEGGAAFIKIIIKDCSEKEQPEFIYDTWK